MAIMIHPSRLAQRLVGKKLAEHFKMEDGSFIAESARPRS